MAAAVVRQRSCRMSNSSAQRDGGWVLDFSQLTQVP